MRQMRFNAYEIHNRKQGYRFLSYGLVHADGLHLFVNMYVLYSFGNWVEFFFSQYFQERSTLYFILLYVGALFASVIPAYEKHKNHSYYNAVGASGDISVVVFSSILFDPLAPMGLLLIPFHFPAVVFGVAYLVYSYYMAKKGTDSIGHDAHFFGEGRFEKGPGTRPYGPSAGSERREQTGRRAGDQDPGVGQAFVMSESC